MAAIIYILCTITAGICAWLLLSNYAKQKSTILLWGGLCFLGLTINNLLLVLDAFVFIETDLSTIRLLTGVVSLLLLLFGLIWEEKS
ncbi:MULTISPECIES: DUF5985 family protein [Legionella]|uniref:Transmembrane protein n=1 Tax=Legionella steelei TaxID=947033 RepID=A0A0W0ZDL7_9GAMM|nr:DUF5985 family protein [Legionella steelei]KTD66886.1 hypothetical protein Lste_3092 [Legionella steelei]OJW16552.1 MAG: hypothetical protein BGO44_00515 [Legionella sp. 39-23]